MINSILKFKINYKQDWPLVIVLFLGFVQIGVQIFINRSLWLDEAMLSLNFIDKSYLELLKPLDNNQVAPIGYLLLVKFFTTIFGLNEFALRLLSNLYYLAFIIVFYLFLKKYITDKFILLSILFCVSFNYFIALFSNEVKQYIGDVFWTTFLIYLYLFKSKNHNVFFSLMLVVAIFFSNIIVVIIFSIGVHLFVTSSFKNFLKNSLIFLPCVSIFLLYWYLFIFNHPTKNFMLEYWSDSFAPVSIFSIEFYTFIFEKYSWCRERGIDFLKHPKLIMLFDFSFLIFYILGILKLIKDKSYQLLYFTLFPLILHLILSMFKFYPFYGRLILYIFPFVILVIICGVENIGLSIVKSNHKFIKICIAAFCMMPSVFSFISLFP